MGIIFAPTNSLPIAADQHGDVVPAVQSWADASTGFSFDRANDRFQIRRGGEETLERSLDALGKWMQDMVNVKKVTFVVNEWPDVLELRNRFELTLSSHGYTAIPTSNGEYSIRGAQSMEVGRVVTTPDGFVAFRGSVLLESNGVETSPQPDARAAFEEFLRTDGLSVGR